MKRKGIVGALITTDEVVKILTGRGLEYHFPKLAVRIIEVFGPETLEKLTRQPQQEVGSPYAVLGIRSDSPDFIVAAAYRAMAKKFHPDVGGDEDKFKQVQKAYEQIAKERGWNGQPD